MQKFFRPGRMITIFVAMAVLLTIYVSALYKLQIYDDGTADMALFSQAQTKREVTLSAARGNIYDRYGVLLVSSRPSYNIVLSRDELLKAPNINEIILSLVYTAAENGVKYIDTFPITRGAPFTFLLDMSGSQKDRLNKYIDYFRALDPEISASDLLAWMKKHYKLDITTGISDLRLIAGVRYELESRVMPGVNIEPYIFAEDVSPEFVSMIMEQGYPGVSIEKSSVREYHTERAAHVIGQVGSMQPGDVPMYTELGYPLNAKVGREGAEKAFEEYLHGVDGKQTVITSDTGAVLDVQVTQMPEPGDNIYLTLDIGLQAAAEDALSSFIDIINQDPNRTENQQATGGAIVIEDVRTGELLACASYPTYDLSTYWQNYTALSIAENSPLMNKATYGLYNPGSTFKMVSAMAGLRTGTITQWSIIDDVGRFTKYPTFQPSCWILGITGHGHGPLNVLGAIENSCNYFFYQLGDMMDRYDIPNMAAEFGLGAKTGLELPERAGSLATPEYKREVLNQSWVTGDTLLSVIGQSYNEFTPVQLANYTATIANSGTRYSMTILNRVKSADFSELVYSHEPTVAGIVDGGGYFDVLQSGMEAVARTGTAASVFSSYPVRIAAKTGTVQSDSTAIDNGVFVCYAPAVNPEIAISIVVEQGKSGSEIMKIAETVLDYYFASSTTAKAPTEGVLLP